MRRTYAASRPRQGRSDDVRTEAAPGRDARGPRTMTRTGDAYGTSVTVPTTAVAPGPGRLALPFTVPFVVAPTQNAEASLTGAGTPMDSAPVGAPTSRTC